MAQIEKKKRLQISPILVLIITSLLSFALLALWGFEGNSGVLHASKSVIGTLASPFKVLGAWSSYPFQTASEVLGDMGANPEKLSELESENAVLKNELSNLEEFKLENQRLQELLALKGTYNAQSIGARVLVGSNSAWTKNVTIDRGKLDGLSAGMPVVGIGGLIGQIEQVDLNTSVVRLITDERSGVAVTLQASRASGILNGSTDGSMKLDYVDSNVEVKEGDVVITSGLGGVFPKGIKAAEVTKVEAHPEDIYHSIWVRPTAFIKGFEEVLVLTGQE